MHQLVNKYTRRLIAGCTVFPIRIRPLCIVCYHGHFNVKACQKL